MKSYLVVKNYLTILFFLTSSIFAKNIHYSKPVKINHQISEKSQLTLDGKSRAYTLSRSNSDTIGIWSERFEGSAAEVEWLFNDPGWEITSLNSNPNSPSVLSPNNSETLSSSSDYSKILINTYSFFLETLSN